MSKDDEELGLDPESVKILQGMRERLDSGENLDPITREAMNSIDFASQIVNAIMAGKQINLAYLKLYIENVNNRINILSNNNQTPRTRRKRRTREKKEEEDL